MKITNRKLIEDCFDNSSIYGYEFDSVWTYESIHELTQFGKLEYFKDFPKPFFRVIGKSGLQIKGVQDEITCRVIYPSQDKEVNRRRFEEFFTEI